MSCDPGCGLASCAFGQQCFRFITLMETSLLAVLKHNTVVPSYPQGYLQDISPKLMPETRDGNDLYRYILSHAYIPVMIKFN